MTLAAIVIPVFSYAPKLYVWFLRRHIVQLYRDLRVIEHGLVPGLQVARLRGYQRDLEKIDHAAGKLPMRHSDLYFELESHIALIRTRLAVALSELQRHAA